MLGYLVQLSEGLRTDFGERVWVHIFKKVMFDDISRLMQNTFLFTLLRGYPRVEDKCNFTPSSQFRSFPLLIRYPGLGSPGGFCRSATNLVTIGPTAGLVMA
jgi:hypothetical protein